MDTRVEPAYDGFDFFSAVPFPVERRQAETGVAASNIESCYSATGAEETSQMTADVTREEFQALEQEVEGEKMVTRHILEQTRRNGDDIAAVKTRLSRVEEKVDGLDRKVDGLDRKLDGLTKSLPGIVRDALNDYEIKSKQRP
jgi:septal ring factor EnvC (AmiA/AmiB activator)